ncbi:MULTISPECIES: DUF3710 domain-containing protein [Actinomadura]|uniref:DUF3710 domain-containing protein n=1 Tax=Actinomadura litoris TaxID=2678616 RepID=A0A7K1KV70_9ACTN|nr:MULTISPECIES: DUF3710 domain-containing protein [Actinomadura]MBT2211163.1 DUF3710 domain-containing protein [Actinomadura sp. NEAU-AAG7]MUN36081.1 DUF3710 domain-containing protein [Actinomadura litoris]
MAFGRRRQAEEPEKDPELTEEPADAVDEAGEEEAAKADSGEGGPWDSEDSFPELQRLDFGSLQVPVAPGLGFQVNFEATQVDEDGNPLDGRPVAVLVQYEESAMQLQVFAAPKRSGIWEDVRRETAKDIQEEANGQTQEGEGPFGPELLAMVPAPLTEEVLAEMPQEVREQIPAEFVEQGWAPQIIRFLGVDGPRWFLQAVVQGAAIEDEEQWQVLEDVLRGVVVVRGDAPMPPRDLLELQIPKEFSEGGDDEGEEGAEQTFDPFERGPEITEVR